MKKNILVLINVIVCAFIANSYNFETIIEIPFDDFFQYQEKYYEEYSGSGIYGLVYYKGEFFACNCSNSTGFVIGKDIKKRDRTIGWDGIVQNNLLFITGTKGRELYLDKFTFGKPDYILKLEDGTFFEMHYGNDLWQTENYIFAQLGRGKMVCWELLGDGKYKYHTSYETRNLLDLGLREKFGITQDREYFYFGEFSLKERGYPNKRNIWKELTFKTPGYEHYTNLQSFRFLGTEKHGLVLHYRMIPVNKEKSADRDPDNPIHLVMGVLDPWTREVNAIELEPNSWDPPRNEYGLIPTLSQCIDPDGNIYFVDCNKAKGCYQIKKLNNDWLKQYDFYTRKIARVNANHIPLTLEPKEECENDGYNFEHEYLWILSQTAEYYYVRKVDGREGFIPKQYATLNPEVDAETIPEYTAPVQAELVSVEPETLQEEVSPEPEIIPEAPASEKQNSGTPKKQSGKKQGKDKKKKK